MDIGALKETLGTELFDQVSEKVAGVENLRVIDTKSGDWVPRARFDEERKASKDALASLDEMRGKLEEADSRFDEASKKHLSQMDKLKANLRERDEKIQTLSGDMETIQHSLETLQGDLKQKEGVIASLNRQVTEKDASIQGLQREQKVRDLVAKSGAREQDVVFRLLDLNKVSETEDGSISGVQEQLDTLKKQSGYLFGGSYSAKGGFDGPRETPKTGGPASKDVNAAIRAAFGR